ncbi:MAG: autotransporter-associated beta strand repeat-containing protein [Pirellulales bacterium]
MELRGTNTYTGFTQVNAGTLVIGSAGAIPAASHVVLNGGALANWELDYTLNSDVTNLSTSSSINVGTAKTMTQAVGSNISGAAFTKTGDGVLVLNGNNSFSALTINAGRVEVSASGNLGDTILPALGAGVTFTTAASNTANGAVLRVTDSLTTPRYITTGANQFGGVDVVAGKTLLINGAVTSIGTGGLVKTGDGTLFVGTASGVVNLNINQGTYATSSNNPFSLAVTGITGSGAASQGTLTVSSATGLAIGQQISGVNVPANSFIVAINGTTVTLNQNIGTTAVAANTSLTIGATATVNLNGGTFLLTRSGADLAVAGATATVLSVGGGGRLALQNGTPGTNSTQLAVLSFARTASTNGTLLVDVGAGLTLGQAGAGGARVIPTNLFGVARASAQINGIFSPVLLGNSGGTPFFLQNDATNGLIAYSGSTVSTISAVTATNIADFTSAQNLTANQTAFAIRTNSDISASGSNRLTIVSVGIAAAGAGQGGLVTYGTPTISAPVVFSGAGLAGGSATSGEGVVYVGGTSTTMTGAITANGFTKFGSGTLILNANAQIFGSAITNGLAVQEGTLRFGPNTQFASGYTALNVNLGATVDLNGQDISVAALNGAQNGSGGIVTNSNAAAATLTLGSNRVTSSWTGRIIDGVGGISLVKMGNQTVTLGANRIDSPDANNNTYTGGTTIYGGQVIAQNPFAFGGFGGSTPGSLDLYSTGVAGQTAGRVDLMADANSLVSNGVIIYGNQSGNGLNVNIRGLATINVDRIVGTAGVGNLIQVGNMTFGNQTLTVSGANGYGLRVAGTTSIAGSFATISSASDAGTAGSGRVELAGLITGNGALNKTSTGGALNNYRTLTISGSGNTWTGGLNVQSGAVRVTATTGTPLGTGMVRVFPGATLRIAGDGSVNIPANLRVLSYNNSVGTITLDNDFVPTILNSTNFGGVYPTGLLLGRPTWSSSLNMSSIGDGGAFLAAGNGAEVQYLGTTLTAGNGATYRVAGGPGGTLTFSGQDNVLTGANLLMVGSPISNALSTTNANAVTNFGGTVRIRNSNDFSGGTFISKGTILELETGAVPGGSTPLGSGTVEVYGTLQLSSDPQGYNGQASFVNAATGANANNIVLRPGGSIVINDQIGQVAGGEGRWDDQGAVDLNGGIFRFNGVTGNQSTETIGNVTVRKFGTLQVVRTGSGSATLNVGTLTAPIAVLSRSLRVPPERSACRVRRRRTSLTASQRPRRKLAPGPRIMAPASLTAAWSPRGSSMHRRTASSDTTPWAKAPASNRCSARALQQRVPSNTAFV